MSSPQNQPFDRLLQRCRAASLVFVALMVFLPAVVTPAKPPAKPAKPKPPKEIYYNIVGEPINPTEDD